MKRVLIVEDQMDIREAENGDEGLALAQRIQPDLILLDIMMPGSLDGFAVCDRVKRDPRTSGTKVVFLSAKGQDADKRQGKLSGGDGYLTKPFSPRQLLEMVNRHLG